MIYFSLIDAGNFQRRVFRHSNFGELLFDKLFGLHFRPVVLD